MKKFRAWILIDNGTGEPLVTEAHPHIFWLRSVAKTIADNDFHGYNLSIKKILIQE